MITQADARSFLSDYSHFVGKSISFVLRSVRNHFGSFLLIVALAAAVALGYWYRLVPYYETDLVCGYNNERMTRKTYGEKLQKLNLLAQSGSYQELARELKIAPELAQKILRIEGRNREGSALYEDVNTNYQSIYCVVRTTDRSVYVPLEPAILEYLNNSPYQQNIGVIEVARLNRKISDLDHDLNKIDSVLDAYSVFLRTVKASDTLAGFSNLSALLSYKDQLEDKRNGLETKLALESGPSVVLLHGFAPADHPVKGDKKNPVLILLVGCILATGWAVWRNTLRSHS